MRDAVAAETGKTRPLVLRGVSTAMKPRSFPAVLVTRQDVICEPEAPHAAWTGYRSP
ncbi:hypothetical protein [Kitasatospora sp. NBC_01302]|uniref:hypothetical protein n=1 Tax=Kitasatospora sp. NBC_01302 TaxID=2903575 RepID=UPI002E120C1D|nr:hypothetical protein OG294_02285 [Kitasatospora sp. NBC_01302]